MPSRERATLSRDLADFLVELSIALHKHAMYPQGHPSLQPAAAAVTRRAALLLEDRATLSLGVARHQLVIEGVATDPKHPVLRELAARLHRHHLGAVTFRRGVDVPEVADALKTLAVEAERTGRPLGLEGAERLAAWPHVQLYALTYERLELAEQEGRDRPAEGDARAAQLWVGLARAALATAPDAATPTEPAVIAEAIDARPKGDAAYDQVIVGYLLQIAAELKTAGGTEAAALRRRTSRLIRTLKPETLRRLVEMGGDFVQRRQFVADVTDGMAVDAVLDILTAAAETAQETISHSLVRLLSKLAAHAEAGAEPVRPQADVALRDQVRRLLEGWTLPDPNPGAYGTALQRMARSAPVATAPREDRNAAEPDRIVAMALEIGTVGPRLGPAIDQVVSDGRLEQLLDALDAVTADGAAREVVRGPRGSGPAHAAPRSRARHCGRTLPRRRRSPVDQPRDRPRVVDGPARAGDSGARPRGGAGRARSTAAAHVGGPHAVRPRQAAAQVSGAPRRSGGARRGLATEPPGAGSPRPGCRLGRPRHPPRGCRPRSAVSGPAGFLTAFAHALAAMTLYTPGHPARQRAIVDAYRELCDLQATDAQPLFTFLGEEIVFGRLPLRELKAWDWGRRLAQAGIQRLEFADAVSREEFEEFLDEVLARLTLSAIDTSEARQLRRSSIRFGAVGIRGEDEGLAAAIPTATINYSLSEEADAVRWVQEEVQAGGMLPLTEAEAVVRSLAIAMHGGRQIVIPLLQLKEFDQYTTTHSMNVAVLAMALAESLGLSARDVRAFGVAGLLHDIGKVKIPLEVLTKPGRFSETERARMNRHPAEGARTILRAE